MELDVPTQGGAPLLYLGLVLFSSLNSYGEYVLIGIFLTLELVLTLFTTLWDFPNLDYVPTPFGAPQVCPNSLWNHFRVGTV